MSHPLVEIRLEQTLYGDPDMRATATVNWYHVPRTGGLIAHSDIQGKVQTVTWVDRDDETEYVIVRLYGKVSSDH